MLPRICLQRLHGRCAGIAQPVVGPGDVQMNLGRRPPPAQIQEAALDLRFAGRLKSAVMDVFAGPIDREIADLLAVLQVRPQAAVGAGIGREVAAVEIEAVFQLDVHRAAERVQAEQGVRGFDRDALDRDRGNEIPVHRVAKRIIEPRPIDVDRQSLRRARDRRRNEAAVDDVRLERIAFDVLDPCARDFTGDRLREGRHAAPGNILRIEDIGRGRDLVAVHVGAGQRGRSDDREFRKDDGLRA